MANAPRSFKLEQLQIASPCTEDWDGMHGDAKSRFCDKCRLDVHNLSAMDRLSAEELLNNRTGRLCVRYEVVGEKIETQPGGSPISRWRRWGSMAAVALASVGLSGMMSMGNDQRREIKSDVAEPRKPATQPAEKNTGGQVVEPDGQGSNRVQLMGKIACPAEPVAADPKPEPKPDPAQPKMFMQGSPTPVVANAGVKPEIKPDVKPEVGTKPIQLMGAVAAPASVASKPVMGEATIKPVDARPATQPSK